MIMNGKKCYILILKIPMLIYIIFGENLSFLGDAQKGSDYMDNLKLVDKYKINYVNLQDKYDYAIMLRIIDRDSEQLKDDDNEINYFGYTDYITESVQSGDSVIFIVSKIDDFVMNENYMNIYLTIKNFLENKLKIDTSDGMIGFYIDIMPIDQLNDLIDNYTIYKHKPLYTNIMTFKIPRKDQDELKIILLDAPKLNDS